MTIGGRTLFACCYLLCLVTGSSSFLLPPSRLVDRHRGFYFLLPEETNNNKFRSVLISSRGGAIERFNDGVSLRAAAAAAVLEEEEEKDSQTKSNNNSKQRLAIRVLAFGLALTCVFAVGFRLGGGDAEVLRASIELQRKRFPFLSILGVVLLLRDGWRAIPAWAKPSLLRRFRSTDATNGNSITDTNKEEASSDDMTDLQVITKKLQTMFDLGQAKLNKEGEEKVPTTKPILALIQLLSQLRERQPQDRTERYQNSGKPGVLKDVEGLDLAFEWADLAYDESSRGPLKDVLLQDGFSLLKHDKTALPGYVGHYVAISREKKLALIGVKGTSNFEDMLTDLCGLSVPSTLDDPFVEGGETTLRCHEGILISSKRLVDDLQPFVENLLLPSGYKLLIVGHSLGAAGAAMLGLFLRSRIPQLAADKKGKHLRVLAFACPPILDYKNAAACSSFITTIVNNSDVIPRTSISNLIIALEVLKDVNAKLVEKGWEGSTAKSSVAFLSKLGEGTKGELLMTASELKETRIRAAAAVDRDDPEHLFVPGRVITMYDTWETKKNATDEDSTTKKEEEERTAEGFITSRDGAIDVLRTIELNERLVADHLSTSYRSSLESVLALAREEEETPPIDGDDDDDFAPEELDFQ